MEPLYIIEHQSQLTQFFASVEHSFNVRDSQDPYSEPYEVYTEVRLLGVDDIFTATSGLQPETNRQYAMTSNVNQIVQQLEAKIVDGSLTRVKGGHVRLDYLEDAE